MPDGLPWPRISIVTPSFNQSRFIEETMRSVLLQGYPDLEYIIIDGGSADGSIDVINKYGPWLSYWISEPDRGQSQALNKGFQKASGEIVAWINSDDFYLPGALCKATCWLSQEAGIYFIYGDCKVVDDNGKGINFYKGKFYFDQDFRAYWNHYVPQPSAFFLHKILDEVGDLNEALNFVMDYDFWVRTSQRHLLYYTGEILAGFRLHSTSKSVASKRRFDPELDTAVRKYWGRPFSLSYLRYFLKRNRHHSGVLRWYAYEALENGDFKKCSKLISRAILKDPFFFFNKKFLSTQNLKNMYLPFLRHFFARALHGNSSYISRSKRDSST
jgi:glycosyltransferase involved in cell wall biosynthesis